MYSPLGGDLGIMAKLGPWANSHSWASVSWVLDRFLIHVEDVNTGALGSLVLCQGLNGHHLSLSGHLFSTGIVPQILTFGTPKP